MSDMLPLTTKTYERYGTFSDTFNDQHDLPDGTQHQNKIVACVSSLQQILIKYDVYVCQWKCVLLYMQERES
jgi:hypothetical protein